MLKALFKSMVLSSSTVKAQLCTAENREKPCFNSMCESSWRWLDYTLIFLHRPFQWLYKPDKHTLLLLPLHFPQLKCQ